MRARVPVSVVIPTHNRPGLLARAVESVLAQTFSEWELVVSDDGPEGGDAWGQISALADRDRRVRIVRNLREPGQMGNTNNALDHSRGEWVKILHDDDILKPSCLKDLLRIVSMEERVACVVCDAEVHPAAGRPRHPRSRGWALAELVPAAEVPVAMYLLEDLAGSRPSQLMVHRRVIEAGLRMQAAPGIRTSLIDSWFKARAARYGPLLVYRVVLVEWHQGHGTITDDDGLRRHDREMMALRDLLWPAIRHRSRLPSPATMKNVVRLQRAAWRMRSAPLRGLREWMGVRDAGAWVQFARWGAHRLSRGRVRSSKRRVLRSPPGIRTRVDP